MTDVERYTTEGSYYSSGRRADRRLSVQAYESLLEIDSVNPTAVNNLARQYAERREYARAESLLTRGVRTGNARATILGNLLSVQVAQGRFAAADSTASMAVRLFPENAFARTLRVSILAGRKQFDSVYKVATATRADDPDIGNRIGAIFLQSEAELIRGRGVEGLRLNEEARSLSESRGAPVPTVIRAMDSAFFDIWFANQPARAVERVHAAMARESYRSMPVEVRPYGNVAITFAPAGRPDRARVVLAARAAETDTSYRRRNEANLHMALGEIALAEGRAADAIREFRLGDRLPDGPRDSCLACTLEALARAFDAAGMADSTIATLERYVQLPSPFPWPDDYALARAHHRLGELYDAKRDVKMAVRHYERFVDLWKNADPPLQPRVAAARARLAILKGS
jgi:tetratricopeptide (TPR) repeat protein